MQFCHTLPGLVQILKGDYVVFEDFGKVDTADGIEIDQEQFLFKLLADLELWFDVVCYS